MLYCTKLPENIVIVTLLIGAVCNQFFVHIDVYDVVALFSDTESTDQDLLLEPE